MHEFIRPLILIDYLNYLKSIKGLSKSTIKEYTYDLEAFIEFQLIRKLYNNDRQDYMDNFNPSKINEYANENFFENLNKIGRASCRERV